MLTFHGKKGVEFCDGLTRRDFLRVGAVGAGAVGMSLADLTALQKAGAADNSNDVNCILLFLVGGPSHLDTFDLKPDAPSHIRGPFRPIKTNVAGIEICEHLPKMARMADRFALVRSVHHREAPIHETGHQLMQTGRLFRGGKEHPHYGSVLSHLRGRSKNGVPAFAVLPGPVGNTGVSVSHGQTAGYLGEKHEPFFLQNAPSMASAYSALNAFASVDPAKTRNRNDWYGVVDEANTVIDVAAGAGVVSADNAEAYDKLFSKKAKKAFDISAESEDLRSRYGRNTFGQSCLMARRLVQSGVRLVTVNMFDSVFNSVTWDCHADGGMLGTNLDDYRDILCPMFDQAYSALLDDLLQRGMLEKTLVVAMGEFGRTPHLNPRGGRDHWPGVWTILFAGNKVKGGQVIGSSDASGAEPKDRPILPNEVAASIYQSMGVDLRTMLPGPEQTMLPIVDAEPIVELFH